MKAHEKFWRLETLSDRQLLERVGSVLGSSRRLMAELIAHLGEVEERRLHLVAACSSMFTYCLKLGMTEDEAYRRIEVARLARRYPTIFPMLADGQLSISVVALLKHYLSDDNHLELLAAIAGKSVVQTRELIAARFPRPDVVSNVRKLPERSAMQPSLAISTPTQTSGAGPCTGGTEPCVPSGVTGSMQGPAHPGAAEDVSASDSMSAAASVEAVRASERPAGSSHTQRLTPRVSSRIEPLSAQRYKVQLTASVELTRKLELARGLMRHSHPSGELGLIVERALDLLIESLMQRRFGKTKKVKGDPAPMPRTAKPDTATLADATKQDDTTHGTANPVDALADATGHDHTVQGTSTQSTAAPTLHTARVHGNPSGERTRPTACSYVPRATRRAVVERDGLGCSWVDECGVRCGSLSWLEYDHRHPRAKGGGSEPDNLRLVCRNHNRFAAEREYGREHVERTIDARRQRAPHGAHAI